MRLGDCARYAFVHAGSFHRYRGPPPSRREAYVDTLKYGESEPQMRLANIFIRCGASKHSYDQVSNTMPRLRCLKGRSRGLPNRLWQ